MGKGAQDSYFTTKEIREETRPAADNNVVEIHVGGPVIWGALAVVGVAAVFAAGLFFGGRFSGPPAAARPVQQAVAPQGQAAAQSSQVEPGQSFPVQPQAQTGPTPAPPAGKDVPIGDAPRLALPEIEGTNYIYDFGDIGPDQKVERTFVIKNTGTQPLIIGDTKSS